VPAIIVSRVGLPGFFIKQRFLYQEDGYKIKMAEQKQSFMFVKGALYRLKDLKVVLPKGRLGLLGEEHRIGDVSVEYLGARLAPSDHMTQNPNFFDKVVHDFRGPSPIPPVFESSTYMIPDNNISDVNRTEIALKNVFLRVDEGWDYKRDGCYL
jgi:hypothetical protein